MAKTKECRQYDCHEEAVGKAWFPVPSKWYPYCRKHLELCKKMGRTIKLFSDTDIVYDEEVENHG